MSFTLYHSIESTCSQKVRLVMAEKDLAWTEHLLNLRKGDQFAPEYLKLNPKAVVPTLVHDGRVVRESTVIAEYLDRVVPYPPLKPTDPYDEAQMRLLVKSIDDDVHGSVGILTFATVLRHQMTALKTAEDIERHFAQIADPMRRERQRVAFEQGLRSAAAKQAALTLRKVFTALAERLRDHDWLVGEAFSLADAAAAPYVVRMRSMDFGGLWNDAPSIDRWLARIESRESWRRLKDPWGSESFANVVRTHAANAAAEIRAVVG